MRHDVRVENAGPERASECLKKGTCLMNWQEWGTNPDKSCWTLVLYSNGETGHRCPYTIAKFYKDSSEERWYRLNQGMAPTHYLILEDSRGVESDLEGFGRYIDNWDKPRGNKK